MRRRKSVNKVRLGWRVGACSVGMMGILGIMMLFPVVSEESFASCVDGTETEECVGSYARTDLSMTTNTVISLTVDKAVNVEVAPRSNGAVGESSAKVGVATNSSEGYAVYLRTGNVDGALKPITSNISGEIKNTELTNVTLDGLETNAYGYALTSTPVDDATTYSRIPTEGGIIKSTTNVTVGSGEYAYGDEYYLSFGTKIGTSLPAGTYSGSVILSVVANPTTLRSLYDLTYMQEMTPELCEATGEHYTKQLIDTRDGKSYWVAKLKDGNCWMTQNLALDITEDGLKASDTDIEEDWNQDSTYPPRNANRIIFNGETVSSFASSGTDYWDFGEIVAGVPMGGLCGSSENSITMEDNIMETCARVGFIDVSDKGKWFPTYVAQRGTYTNPTDYTFQGLVAVECTAKDEQGYCVAGYYDSHYLLGNYYQYNTVAAGTAAQLVSMDGSALNASSSICPKGWGLPTSGVGNFETPGSLGYLLRQYGFATSDNTGAPIVINGANREYIAEEPLYMVRTGAVRLDYKYLRRLGLDTALTSATAGTSLSARFTLVSTDTNSPTSLNSMASSARYDGFSVRCMAK